MPSAEKILTLYRDRKAAYAELHGKMREIGDVYNGNIDIPLPDMDRDDEHPSVPNLLAQGVDQMAGRIASITPQVAFVSNKPGVRKYDRMAHDAGRVLTGWWQADRLTMKQKIRARRLIAYGMAPTVMRWDYKDHRPVWEVRHPLEALPSLDLQPGQVRPQDAIFSFTRTVGWLIGRGYSPHLSALMGDRETPTRDTKVTVLEYVDGGEHVLMAAGHYNVNLYGYDMVNMGVADVNGLRGVVLERYANLAEEAPVTIPTRLTLDRMTGQFDTMLGIYYQQAKLMALETIAVEKGIFPDTYLVSRAGEIAKFVDGPHDGRTGKVNIITGGDIRELQTQPGYLTNPTIDRLERAQRVTAGIPAEFGGESGSNIRTGRRGDAVLSAVIDFPVAEAQEAFAYSLEEENEIAMQMARRIDGDTKRTIFVGTGNNRRPVSYVPTETFEQTEHVVSYPAAGSDINSLVIGLGQRVGLGTMSKKTAAHLDPFIENPEIEHDTIIAEGLEQALLSGIQQQASEGALPPLVLAKIMALVSDDKMELAEAMHKVTEDAMKEQQAAQQGMAPETPEAAMAGPAAAAMTGSPIPGASEGQADLAGLLSTLRKPAMTIQPMKGVARGAM
jgi:hypothetical protein